jgi:aspartate/methionine/tyrosine aminotransferase
MLFSTLLETGEEIILSDPHYPCYPNFANFINAKPVFVNVYEEDGFQFRPEDIKKKIGPRTKAILINSPSNPTGNLLSPERMKNIAGLGPYVISDEIYHGLVYEDKEHSILEFTDKAFVLNGFSKLFAMTGWRLGYIIAPMGFIRPLQKIQQNFFISAGSVSQLAGLEALTGAEADVERMRSIYNERRKYMIQRLRDLGFGLTVEPRGAFYMLANAKHLSNNSYDLAFEILERAGVGVSPGIDFGKNAEGYLRFSYANSLENIKEGLNRIENFLGHR